MSDMQIREKLPPIGRPAIGILQNDQHGALAEASHFRMTNLNTAPLLIVIRIGSNGRRVKRFLSASRVIPNIISPRTGNGHWAQTPETPLLSPHPSCSFGYLFYVFEASKSFRLVQQRSVPKPLFTGIDFLRMLLPSPLHRRHRGTIR